MTGANREMDLETLISWQKALAFANSVYSKVLPILPKEEKWILGSQIRRSAQSIPANIAEGYGRYHYLDSVRFFYTARGSLEETYSHLCLAKLQAFIPVPLFIELEKQVLELRRLINGYIKFLKDSKQGVNEVMPPHTIKETESIYEDRDLSLNDFHDPTET
jgi:four helix bundle protein